MTHPTHAPHADCVADSAGGITFDIADVAAAEPVLVLRLRGSAPAVEHRLPLTPTGGGHFRAVLPSTLELSEGCWDAYVDDRAVEPGIRDVRALTGRVPEPTGRVAARIPYPTADGRLAVRSWVRVPHAEAGDLTFGEATCRVEGTLYGTRLGPGATAEARLGTQVHEIPVEGEGDTFAFTVPYALLAGSGVPKQQLWTLWLRPTEATDAIRLARILDDVWDRKSVFVYPEHKGDGYCAAPCYTTDNELCIRIAP